jgi:formate/nitrite transporter FocA (FNT family)
MEIGGVNAQAGQRSPNLDEREQQQAAAHAHMGPVVIHEIIREQGEAELTRSVSGLALSGLAAGLSIGFSFVAQAYLQSGLPEANWSRLVGSFGYSLGFLIVILGQQQLYTESTLTALIPTLTERTLPSLFRTLRVWMIVLIANLSGTVVFGSIAACRGIFSPGAYAAMSKLSAQTMAHGFAQTAITAGSAGWLIGLMVWLLPAAGAARPLVIILLSYVVALCQFPHIIAGSVEAVFGVVSGAASGSDYLLRFFIPTIVGNTIGGTILVALLNHAPLARELAVAPEK